jgi:release factor glutamine methyltransferase
MTEVTPAQAARPLDLVTAWKQTTGRFKAAGLDGPVIDARLLLEFATGATRTDIVTDPYRVLDVGARQRLEDVITRRLAREPVSQITGERGFWKHVFHVTRDVLTPRPETETVVERALRHLPADYDGPILDLGVGSGAILLSLLAERPNATGIGVDISPAALEVAAANAARLGLTERVQFHAADWEHPSLRDWLGGPVPLIVSNPPYIAQWEMPLLAPEVRVWEPGIALVGGEDGLSAYRVLADVLPGLLSPEGVFLLEIGATQAEAVHALLEAPGGLRVEAIVEDLATRPRVVIGRPAAAGGVAKLLA